MADTRDDVSSDDLTPAQMAYALLWRSPSKEHYVFEARQLLLNSISRDEQRAAIAWVVEKYGMMSTGELIAADIRSGNYPEKGYAP